MLRITIIILYLHSVSGKANLSITKREDGANTAIVDTMVEVQKGTSFVLTCSVRYLEKIYDDTLWTKSNNNLARHQLQFNRVRLKDQGEYTCSNYFFKLTKTLELRVLPETISAQFKQNVFDWKQTQPNTNAFSSSNVSNNKLAKPDFSSYVEFCLVVFVIIMVGLGIFSVYYLLRRHWWKGGGRTRRIRRRRFIPPARGVCNLSITESLAGEPICNSPPSYSDHIVMNDLPPSYDEAVVNMRN